MTKKKDQEPSFEAGMAELEDVISLLDTGDLDLDKSLTAFEKGVQLIKSLNRKLDEAEKRLEVLVKNEKGDVSTGEFVLVGEDGDES
jgi:exodeoxyribonuclease VII small subunit